MVRGSTPTPAVSPFPRNPVMLGTFAQLLVVIRPVFDQSWVRLLGGGKPVTGSGSWSGQAVLFGTVRSSSRSTAARAGVRPRRGRREDGRSQFVRVVNKGVTPARPESGGFS